MEIQSSAVKPIGAFEDGWNIIKDDYWTFFGMTTVFVVILIAMSFVVSLINNLISTAVAVVLGAASSGSDAGNVAAAIVPQVVSLTISIFTSIILSTITGILMCGLMNALSRKVRTGLFEFGDLFGGFDKLKPCLVYALIMSLIQYVIAIGGLTIGVVFGVSLSANSILKGGKIDPAVLSGVLGIFGVLLIIFLLITLVIAICTIFVYPLISERNLSGLEAFATSAKGGFSNFPQLILLLILQFLMVFAGVLLCLVGFLFVLPILYASTFAAYRSVFGSPQGGNLYNQQPPPPPIFNNQPGY